MELVMLILAVLTLVCNIVSTVIAAKALRHMNGAATTRNSDGSVATKK